MRLLHTSFKKNIFVALILLKSTFLVAHLEVEQPVEDEADVCQDKACMTQEAPSDQTHWCTHTLPYIQKFSQVVQTTALFFALYGIVLKKEREFLGGVSFYLPATFLELALYRSQVAWCYE